MSLPSYQRLSWTNAPQSADTILDRRLRRSIETLLHTSSAARRRHLSLWRRASSAAPSAISTSSPTQLLPTRRPQPRPPSVEKDRIPITDLDSRVPAPPVSQVEKVPPSLQPYPHLPRPTSPNTPTTSSIIVSREGPSLFYIPLGPPAGAPLLSGVEKVLRRRLLGRL